MTTTPMAYNLQAKIDGEIEDDSSIKDSGIEGGSIKDSSIDGGGGNLPKNRWNSLKRGTFIQYKKIDSSIKKGYVRHVKDDHLYLESISNGRKGDYGYYMWMLKFDTINFIKVLEEPKITDISILEKKVDILMNKFEKISEMLVETQLTINNNKKILKFLITKLSKHKLINLSELKQHLK
jgi:uncharacterized coiled-coil protein SlyX